MSFFLFGWGWLSKDEYIDWYDDAHIPGSSKLELNIVGSCYILNFYLYPILINELFRDHES